MTMPIWMASPPEVHSGLLSSGPGPGPLLGAAAAWSTLSTQYAETAEELTALLATVQAGAWEGPTAEAYVTAYAPYVTWLAQASADSAATATRQETAATAYTTALAAMPTLPELAANHATHATLVATNFFGVNTIPIALNEADYVRMWIQAATVMGSYQATSTAAAASAPHTTAAPQIVKSDAPPATADSGLQVPTIWELFTGIDHVIEQTLPPGIRQSIGTVFWFLESPANLASQLQYNFPTTHIPAITWAGAFNELFVLDPYYYEIYWPTVVSAAGDNPAMLLWFSTIYMLQIGMDYAWEIAHVTYLLGANGLLTPAALPLLAAPAGMGALGGFPGLAGLAGLAHPPMVPIAAPAPAVPISSPPPTAPATMPTTVATVTPTPAPTPAPTVPPTPGAPPPPPPVGSGPFGYLVGGLEMSAQTGARAGTRTRAPAPDTAAAPAAAAATQEQTHGRRRRRSKAEQPGRGYEYMDLQPATDQDPSEPAAEPRTAATASDHGGTIPGFAGTAGKQTARAAGLTALADDPFGHGPRVPMMPATWDGDSAPPPETWAREHRT